MLVAVRARGFEPSTSEATRTSKPGVPVDFATCADWTSLETVLLRRRGMRRLLGATCSARIPTKRFVPGAGHPCSLQMTDERLRAEDSIEEITPEASRKNDWSPPLVCCERGALGGDELVAVDPGRDQFVRGTELLLGSGFRIAIAIAIGVVEARGSKQRRELPPRRARNDGEVELVGNARSNT